MFFFDPLYLLFASPGLLLAFWAQSRVKVVFADIIPFKIVFPIIEKLSSHTSLPTVRDRFADIPSVEIAKDELLFMPQLVDHIFKGVLLRSVQL